MFENEKPRLRLVFSDYNGAEPEGDNMNPSIILVDWFVFYEMVYVHKAKITLQQGGLPYGEICLLYSRRFSYA